MTTQLRRVVTVTLDPSQEIGDLEAGPVFTDEYTTLVCSDDPADLDNLLRLDGIQEELVTDYLTEWSRVAAKMAEQENIDLYVAVAAVEPRLAPTAATHPSTRSPTSNSHSVT